MEMTFETFKIIQDLKNELLYFVKEIYDQHQYFTFKTTVSKYHKRLELSCIIKNENDYVFRKELYVNEYGENYLDFDIQTSFIQFYFIQHFSKDVTNLLSFLENKALRKSLNPYSNENK